MINYLGVPVGTIVGITFGIATAVIAGITILCIAVLVWMCCKNGHQHRKYELPGGEDGNHEIQVSVHDKN